LRASVLRELIVEFPFVGVGSRSVALSAMLTAAVRRSLDHAPMHAFDSPVAGSGKSKLVDLASMIATGHEAPVIAACKSDEELKRWPSSGCPAPGEGYRSPGAAASAPP